MKIILISITLFAVAVTDAKHINLKATVQNGRPDDFYLNGDSFAKREHLLFRDWMTWMVSFLQKYLHYTEIPNFFSFRKVRLLSTK